MEKNIEEPLYKRVVLAVVAFFFGIVSIIMWAVPVIKFKTSEVFVGSYLHDITGFQLAFGGKVLRSNSGPYPPMELDLNPCPLATLTFVLIALAFALCIISFVFTIKGVNNKAYRIIVIVSIVLFLIGGIMCFFLDKYFAISTQSEELSFYKAKMTNDYNVCPFYAILTITCSFITGLQIIYFKKSN